MEVARRAKFMSDLGDRIAKTCTEWGTRRKEQEGSVVSYLSSWGSVVIKGVFREQVMSPVQGMWNRECLVYSKRRCFSCLWGKCGPVA